MPAEALAEISDEVQDAHEESSASTDVKETESSTVKEETLADVVQKAAEKHKVTEKSKVKDGEKEEVTEETEDQEPEKDEEESEVEESTEEETEEESKEEKPPFHDHPRWKEVIKERNELREKFESVQPKAQMAEALGQYCRDNNIGQTELQEALEMAALAKNNASEFRKRIGQFAENLDIANGSRLPEDLQKKVEDGIVDEETAQELAKTRLQLRHETEGSRRSSQEAANASQQAIASALDSWEQTVKSSDPGYSNWSDILQDRMVRLWHQSPPRSAKDAIQLAEKARNEVKSNLSKFQPKPEKRKVLRSNTSSTNNGQNFKLDNLATDLPKLVQAVAARHR